MLQAHRAGNVRRTINRRLRRNEEARLYHWRQRNRLPPDALTSEPNGHSRISRSPLQRHLEVLRSPFLHEADAGGPDDVDDQVGVVQRPQVLPQERVGLPDLLKQRPAATTSATPCWAPYPPPDQAFDGGGRLEACPGSWENPHARDPALAPASSGPRRVRPPS